MALSPVQLPPGGARGGSPSEFPNRFFDMNFVRWRSRSIQPIGGWQKLTSSAMASPARSLMSWRDLDRIGRTMVLCDSKMYAVDSGAITEVNPTDFSGASGTTGAGYGVGGYGQEDYGDARSVTSIIGLRPYTWSQGSWGELNLSISSSDGRLLLWDPNTPSTRAAAVSGAPTNNQAMIVTPERHVLVSGADNNPRRLAWCSREDYTDWNFASTTNTAGYLDLDTGGFLSTLWPVRDGSIMFSDDELWLIRYVGQPYIYGADRIGENVQPMTPMGVASFGGRAVWMGREGFWLYQGGVVTPLPCDIADLIFTEINRDFAPYRVTAGCNGIFSEIWWMYPSGTNSENNKYVIWNYAENWWAFGTLGRTAMMDAAVYDKPIMAGTDGYLYRHEVGWLADGITRVGSVYAETSAMSLGAGDQVFDVTGAQLDNSFGVQDIRVKAYCRLNRQGTERVYGPYTPRADGYTDMRFTARDLRLRFEANSDADFGIGVPRFEMQLAGQR